jgi:hypothetical protein
MSETRKPKRVIHPWTTPLALILTSALIFAAYTLHEKPLPCRLHSAALCQHDEDPNRDRGGIFIGEPSAHRP